MKHKEYDIIVVGGGHAGCEAAAASARLGSKVLLLTMNINTIGQMSCNPAVGGVAKGQIVRELDALGGLTGKVTDAATIQFRMLNKSKGPAMWSPRAQCDKEVFSSLWRAELFYIPNLDIYQDSAVDIIIKNYKVEGVITSQGLSINCKAVIFTTGTFLDGLIHIGDKKLKGGRLGENASVSLAKNLESFDFKIGRMKTGTPPRIDKRSIDFSKSEEQPSDEDCPNFSFYYSPNNNLPQRSCFITYTNPRVHEIIQSYKEVSPLFNGQINSVGPRYCPSIEDKVYRFASKERHQIFIEPETTFGNEMYINGFSTSMPLEAQQDALKEIEAFKDAVFTRPGYAIEYDYIDPLELDSYLQTRKIKNLFLAGQINGTTGYEEAAAQGLMAGINAHNILTDKKPLTLKRSDAYIGVLINDLTTKGTSEPYRMFTSRAEYRILLRQDNADERLSQIGYDTGLLSQDFYNVYQTKKNNIESLRGFIEKTSLKPEEINPYLSEKETTPIETPTRIKKIFTRPNVYLIDNKKLLEQRTEKSLDEEVLKQVDIVIKYQVYTDKEKEFVEKIEKLEDFTIPEDTDFDKIKSLSTEGKDKLTKLKPKTIGEAKQISGVSISDIQVLLVYYGR